MSRRLRAVGAAFAATLLFGTLAYLANCVALDYHLSNLVGDPHDLYGARNLLLPRIIRTVIASIPAAFACVAIYKLLQNGAPRFGLAAMLVVVGFIAVGAAFAVGDPAAAVVAPHRAVLLCVYIAVLSGALARLIWSPLAS